MKLFFKQLHNKKRSGFTMMELLMVIAIIVILIGVSVPAVGLLRRNLRQRELDSKAEVIYMAAQSRLTQLRTGGFKSLYAKDVDGVHKDPVPADAYNQNGEAENLLFVVSGEKKAVANVLLPEGSVDEELWKNDWVIEYDPESSQVYAVFYSAESMLDRQGSADSLMEKLNTLRQKSSRLEENAWVGYYGGELTQSKVVDPDQMTAEIKIINKEKLIAELYCNSASRPQQFLVTIKDSENHRYTKKITDFSQNTPGVYKATLVLDSLESPNTTFYQVTEGKLLCGTQITVTLETSRELDAQNTLTATATATTNSLFADRTDGITAYISYGRHLQNLDDNTSHVLYSLGNTTTNLTRAVQTTDISFLKSDDADSFYQTYGENKTFNPIHNDRLTYYSGKDTEIADGTHAINGLRIDSQENSVGLFSTFSGTIENLLLTGPQVYGTAGSLGTGALIGTVSGVRKTSIRYVQAFLSERLGDLDGAKGKDITQVKAWLKGRNVGGLVGAISSGELEITNSSASLPIEADQYAGGLIGTVNSKVTVRSSYADSYLRGAYVGGLIGGAGSRGNITLSSFYAVGYGQATKAAAGFVVFDEDYKPLKSTYNGYSAMDLTLKDPTSGTRYSTAPNCVSAVRTYYVPLETDSAFDAGTDNRKDCENEGVEGMDYTVLASDSAFGTTVNGRPVYRLVAPFTPGSGSGKITVPYNLMNQGLGSVYTFPKLTTDERTDLPHYGDWKAAFESGALAYFEKAVKNGRTVYRFAGGNVSIDEIDADSTLPDYTARTHLTGDGYALAYTEAKGSDWDGILTLNGSDYEMKNFEQLRVGKYYLYRIPEELLNNDNAVNANSFYQTLTVREKKQADGSYAITKTYYFNPNFASCFGGSEEAKPEIIRIRTPRQLYALSRLYGTYAQKLLFRDTIFRQEMDLDYTVYEWNKFYKNGFYTKGEAVVQKPIGSENTGFFCTYDGLCNTIEGVSIQTEKGENQTGLFGRVSASGKINNVVLLGERARDNQDTVFGTVDHKEGGISKAEGIETVNLGALVGWNQGTVSNCAVSGFRFDLAAYSGATVNLGGLVGRNDGGTIIMCSAETPHIYLRASFSSIYAGGFVGDNSGSIYASHAAGYLEMAEAKLDTRNQTARIAGFAAKNDGGNLVRCYAGTPLFSSGSTEMYGFARSGGSTIGCYYLDGGTYEYRDQIYSLNISELADETTVQTSRGTAIGSAELVTMVDRLDGYGEAAVTSLGKRGFSYPFPESVSRNGSKIHFGDWPTQNPNVGQFGVFYWEYEQGGNTGYHMTFRGNDTDLAGRSTLCQAHDDGGVITMYGYGYYYEPSANVAEGEDDPLKPELEALYCSLGEPDATASEALQEQVPKYRFVAYRTGLGNGQLHLVGDQKNEFTEANQNAQWTLKTQGVNELGQTVKKEYTYSVSPFFADAYDLTKVTTTTLSGQKEELEDNLVEYRNSVPGAESRPYQVRSAEQLQYINWNYITGDTKTSIDLTNENRVYRGYPYLSSGKNGQATVTVSGLYWKQTHDISGKTVTDYAPIGGMYDQAGATNQANATMAYFSSSYDGQAYVIQNLAIDSDAQCVGVFGVTSGAQLKNIVMYSNEDTVIRHGTSYAYDAKGAQVGTWYSMGGLVGMAGSPGSVGTMTNCTVSGYKIIDEQQAFPDWGGGCVGGLVGTSTMNLSHCSAVCNITIAVAYGTDANNRVGGLVGCARSKIDQCYAGGTIVNDGSSHVKLWGGGILGGIVLRNKGNLHELIGSSTEATTLSNCYGYVQFQGNFNAKYAIGSNGEMLAVCAPVEIDYIVINNCYALMATSKGTDDYKEARYSGGKDDEKPKAESFTKANFAWNKEGGTSAPDWDQGGKNVPFQWNDRRVEVTNEHNPFLTYKEMRDKLQEWLGGDFGKVTTTENGASINGKYSFPGKGNDLTGLDYPFPTILTQWDVTGSTQVNVHYGDWPRFGIFWEDSSITVDLLANRNTSGVNLLALFEGLEEPIVEEQAAIDSEEPAKPETTVPETITPETTVPETTPPETIAPETTDQKTTVPEITLEAAAAQAAPVLELPVETPAAEDPEAEKSQPEEAGQVATVQAAYQALDARSLQAVVNVKLHVVGIGRFNVDGPTFEVLDENGDKIEDTTTAAAIVGDFTRPKDNPEVFTVPILAQHPGTVKIKATAVKDSGEAEDDPRYPRTEYTDILTVTVTADLKIVVDADSLPLQAYEGESLEDLKVELTDANGTPFAAGKDAELTWDLSIISQESEEDAVTWTAGQFLTEKDVPIAGETGTQKVTYLTSLVGKTAGEATLRLGLTYTWDKNTDEEDSVTSYANIPVKIKPSDVLGLGDGVASREVTIPKVPKDGQFEAATRDESKEVPKLEGAQYFLYVSNEYDKEENRVSYTDLENFDIEKVQLKLRNSYQDMSYVSEDPEQPERETVDFTLGTGDNAVTVKVSKKATLEGSFGYRPITVEGTGDSQWSLKLTLRPKSTDGQQINRTYTLEYARPNTVSFQYKDAEGNLTELKSYRVEQGKDLSELNQDDLNEQLARLAAGKEITLNAGEGYRFSWPIPEGTVTQNLVIIQEKLPITYYVGYNAGYEGYEWDDNVPMERSAFTYDPEAANKLKSNEYSRPGYTFRGWAVAGDRTKVVFTDEQEVTAGALFTACGQEYNQGMILNLYAVWEMKYYTFTFEPSGGDGAMEKRSVTAETAGLLAQDPFTREHYTLQGWAFTSGGPAVIAADASVEEAIRQYDQTVNAAGTHTGKQGDPIPVTLYAVWAPTEYRIHYDANFEGWDDEEGTAGTMEDTIFTVLTHGGTLRSCAFIREGYSFVGWSYTQEPGDTSISKNADVDTVIRQGGQEIRYEDVTLYALWEEVQEPEEDEESGPDEEPVDEQPERLTPPEGASEEQDLPEVPEKPEEPLEQEPPKEPESSDKPDTTEEPETESEESGESEEGGEA